MTERNYIIDLVRFLLILWIILFHYTIGYNGNALVKPILFPVSFNSGGPVGTTLFFILAGFFMGKKLFIGQSINLKEYLKYCLKRYFRFWPAYALAVIIIFAWLQLLPVPSLQVRWSEFLVNLFFIIHPGSYVDGAHWFIAVLLVAQFVIFLVKFAPPQSTKFSVSVREIVLSISFVFLGILSILLSGHNSLKLVFIDSSIKIILGLFLYSCVKERSRMHYVQIFISTLFVSWLLRKYLLAFIPLYLMLVLIIQLRPQIPSKIGEVFGFLGDISFSWYLIHQNIGYSLLYHFCPIGNISLVWICFPLFATLLLAIIVHHASNSINKHISIINNTEIKRIL